VSRKLVAIHSDWLRERSWGDKIDAESVLRRIKDLEKDEKFNL
jgi:hypothetical protein